MVKNLNPMTINISGDPSSALFTGLCLLNQKSSLKIQTLVLILQELDFMKY